jgi:HK97 gp10 family phage protein
MIRYDTKVDWHPETFLTKLDETVLNGLDKLGQQIEDDAKGYCPVVTGKLRESIVHTVNTDDFSVKVEATAPYAYYVETGTVKMAPRAYMRQAYYINLNNIIKFFK